ncbi:tRNA isopentenyltransferase [Gigaspora margarita]|uniref:tRNA dimethylallyltransferase n=1 Tax=Gigaspora margarita TaxID=4874 RepID=A0A8H4EF75_GIGMA|nr:tRNA isopentenyltransferase [Gigaspora margarita]
MNSFLSPFKLLATLQQTYLRIVNKMPKGVIAVVGTTGVGKSELGIQLAKALHGEVINGDSMQVYKGLDIITNKMPMEEREGIPHHLMDFLEPHQEYRVTEFTEDAIKIIKDIHSRDRVPIIVGGTHYYIQSLLWKNSLIKGYDGDCDNDSEDDEILNSETDVLYKRLQEVDPIMANKWHWNDRRKIRRSLQIYLQTGKRHSDWIKEQHLPDEKASSLRFPLTCIFWLYADPKVLDQRLDKRVDNMIKMGLFEELKYLRNKVKNDISYGGSVNYTRGIFQAIGYKEFEAYLNALEETPHLDDKVIDAIKETSIEAMKSATRRYSRKQIRWIRNKLLLKCQESNLNDADTNSLEKWNQDVRDVATTIAKEFLDKGTGPDPKSLSSEANELLDPVIDTDTFDNLKTWTKYQCDLCKIFNDNSPVVINGLANWNQHLQSKWHRSNVKLKKDMDINWGGQFPPWFKERKKKKY